MPAGANKKWSQFACYAVALGTSLVLQVAHPEMFALLCTPLPVSGLLNNRSERLEIPLNDPVVPPQTKDYK